VQQVRICSVVIAATPLPKAGRLTRSLEGGTDYVERFLPLQPAGFVWKSCLFYDFEDFDFLHLEMERTREKPLLAQCGVVDVSGAKVSVIGNIHVTKD
jgi:hypothetical protein